MPSVKKSKSKAIIDWEIKADTLYERIKATRDNFSNDKDIAKFVKDGIFDKLELFVTIQELVACKEQAQKAKIAEEHAVFMTIKDDLSITEGLQEELNKEKDNNIKVLKAREL